MDDAFGVSARIGLVGLGHMGKPMASRLVRAGRSVTVHSRSPGPVDDLVALGARRAGSPVEVARASDVVITMLPATDDVRAVIAAPGGVIDGVRAGTVVIDMSTIDFIATRDLATLISPRGAALIDAPVSGGVPGATNGTLSIMVGGPREAFDHVLPIFRLLGSTITYCGDSGAGQVAKACNQLIVGSTIQAVAEALLLGAAAGVDPAVLRSALLGGFAASRVLEAHGERMLRRDFEPGGAAYLHDKDAGIILALARQVAVPVAGFLPFAESIHSLVARGDGALDHSAVFSIVEERARAIAAGEREPAR